MSYIANTAFEALTPRPHDGTLDVSGKLVTGGEDEVCSSGFLVTHKDLIPVKGYPGIKNTNTWNFEAAVDGASGALGAGGIYAFDSYDVQKLSNGENTWAVGADTLHLTLPKGEIGNFKRIMPEDMYAFGEGNFATKPGTDETDIYYAIANGLLVASATAPAAGSGLYFKYIKTENFTTGVYDAGKKYVCRALVA